MRIVRSVAEWSAALALCLLSVASGAAQPAAGAGQDPQAGARLFESKGCAKCHAVNGVGGKVGPDLGRTARPHTFYDMAAALWNHSPRMNERMKQLGVPRPKLDAREAGDVVAYLYTVNYFEQPGSAEVGQRLFTEKRCAACHAAQGGGAPDLEVFKRFRSPIYLAAALWSHGPQMADAMKARGIERPTFTGSDLRDLSAHLGASASGPMWVLPGDGERGRMLFSEKACIQCHAVGTAGGGVGPDLVGLGVRRSPTEFAAAMWNKAPAMLSAMQAKGIAVPPLRPEEMADLVAYLYAVRYFGDAGDIQRGFAVATAKGCLACHGLRGERGKPAGDLAAYKGLATPQGVLSALWNHALVTAPAPGGGRAPWPTIRPDEMRDLTAVLMSVGQRPPR